MLAKRFLSALSLGWAPYLVAHSALASEALEFWDLFKSASGTIQIVSGQKAQQFQISTAPGALSVAGVVLDAATLPQPYRSEFGRKKVIQLIFSSNGTAAEKKLFGSASIFLENPEAEKTKVQIGARSPLKGPMALLSFSWPEVSDPKDLRALVASKLTGLRGTLELTQASAPKSVQLKAGQFKQRAFDCKLDGVLSTPFSPTLFKVNGKFLTQVLEPKNEAAKALMDEIARERLAGPLGQRAITAEK